MGTYQFDMCISASDPTGRSVSPQDLAESLGIDTAPYTIWGLNEHGAGAQLSVEQIHLEDFDDQEEPTEAFAAATLNALQEFAVWLTRLPTEALDTMRAGGFNLVAMIYCWIDGDMFDLVLPPDLMAELGRLKLPLQLMTEGQ